MLIQSLVLIATMLVLAGAIMTSTLVSAKAILHQTMLSKTQTAMTDATAAFVAYGQAFVKNHGTEQTRWTTQSPTTESMCASTSALAACPYIATVSWNVTGTSAASAGKNVSSGTANASYLANEIDEQRVSATISVVLTDRSGKIVYSERSREVTARIFDAAPYLVVTGVREIGSAAGDEHASEGDTGGVKQNDGFNGNAERNVGQLAFISDTRILTSVDCENSTGTPPYHDSKIRPYGNLAWVNEDSCADAKITQGVPDGYAMPVGSLFVALPENPTSPWRKGDEDSGVFPR